jgi:hypothetical protein
LAAETYAGRTGTGTKRARRDSFHGADRRSASGGARAFKASVRRGRGGRSRLLRALRTAWSALMPSARTRKRLVRHSRQAVREAPLAVQTIVLFLGVVVAWFVVNGIYQVVRKPTELYFPVSGVLGKTPAETWRQYEPLFRRHSTPVMTPELLAALAQVEGSGNPVARTYWRWRLTPEPFEVYRPASSAVGMYQITDGTFRLAQRYCIRDHAVVNDGPWHDWSSCWFNWAYLRVVPSHAVEMTSALLDRQVAQILARHRIERATATQKQNLAATIHLCGAGAGDGYARRGFRFADGARCGDHDADRYVARVNAMKQVFAGFAAGAATPDRAAMERR